MSLQAQSCDQCSAKTPDLVVWVPAQGPMQALCGSCAAALGLDTHGATPADSPRPAVGGDATEPGDPSGVGDLAEAGEREHENEAGVAECDLAPRPGVGDLGGSVECHSRPVPPMSSGGATPTNGVQLILHVKCLICDGPVPDHIGKGRPPATCGSARCRKEHRRRKSFDARTKRRQVGAP